MDSGKAEDNRFFYDVTAVGKTDWTDAHEEIAGLDAPAIFGRCDELTGRDWDLRTEGLLKIVTWKAKERLCALFVFHHLLTDGRGALGLVQEFADCYVTGRCPACVQERLIARAEDLPDGAALKGGARWLVARQSEVARRGAAAGLRRLSFLRGRVRPVAEGRAPVRDDRRRAPRAAERAVP